MAPRKHRDNRQPRTLVTIVRDRSGSMSRRQEATISSSKEYLAKLKSESEGEVLLSLVEFDDQISDRFWFRPLTQVRTADVTNYWVGGMTALYDAVGHAITKIEREERSDDRVVVVILTDGLENHSKRYSQRAIRDMVHNREKDGWDFIYLGAGRDAWQGGEALGLSYGQTIYYDENPHSHYGAVMATAQATNVATRNARGSGASVMYLASSDVKTTLESQAGSRSSTPRSIPGDSHIPTTSMSTSGNGNSFQAKSKRASKQARDAHGRFIRK